MGFELEVNRILEFIPVTNLKPDTDVAEDAVAMTQNFFKKDKYRQVSYFKLNLKFIYSLFRPYFSPPQ